MHEVSSLIGGQGVSFKTGRVGRAAVYEAKGLTVFGMPGNKHCPDLQRRRALTQNALWQGAERSVRRCSDSEDLIHGPR